MDYEAIDELYKLSEACDSINRQLVDAKEKHAMIEIKLFKALSTVAGSEKLSRDNRIIALMRNGNDAVAQEFVDSENHVSSLNQAYRYAENMINVKKHINNISNIK